MRKKQYILLTLLLLAGAARSQTITAVIPDGDSLMVQYTLPTYPVKTDYQLSVYTAVCGAHDTLMLDTIVYQGTQNIRRQHRDFVLNAPRGSVEKTYSSYKKQPSVNTFSTIVPRQGNEWLLTDTICMCAMSRMKEGCCRQVELGSVCGDPYLRSGEQKTEETEDTVITLPHYQTLPATMPLYVTRQVPEVVRRVNSGMLRALEDYRPYVRTEILSKDSDALYVLFPLDDQVLHPSFRGNQAILDSILYLVGELNRSNETEVKIVQIIGLASMEGTIAHNEQLARNRALALEKYITDNYPDLNPDVFETVGGGEAWTELRYQAEMSPRFLGQDEVIDIIDHIADPNERERQIKALNDGKTYDYILKNLLYNQRNSGYIRIYYDVSDDVARMINKAVRLIQLADVAGSEQESIENIEEALRMLRMVESDSRSWNALGVALWRHGDKDEAITYWQRAAKQGNAEAANNLQLIGKTEN